MNNDRIHRLLRLLITLLGAGIGAAATLGAVMLIRMSGSADVLTLGRLVGAYAISALLFALLAYWLSDSIVRGFADAFARMIRILDSMTIGQLISCISGTVIGFVIAALLAQILHFMGDSLFTTVCSCILYLVFGLSGYTLGHHRAADVEQLLCGTAPRKRRYFAKKQLRHALRPGSVPCSVLDASTLIDGRIAEVIRAGWLDGRVVVPPCVMEELSRLADSADAHKRARGKRGLDILAGLTGAMTDVDAEEGDSVDARLLRLCAQRGWTLVTCDMNLCKLAQVAGVRALNLNALAGALRPVVLAGEELSIAVQKEGREPGQGVGYLSDGTMLVVQGGARFVGETITVVVTSALQTSAGRMIFAKPRDEQG